MDEAIACGYDGYTVALPCGTSLSGRQETAGKKGSNVMLETDDAHRRAVLPNWWNWHNARERA